MAKKKSFDAKTYKDTSSTWHKTLTLVVVGAKAAKAHPDSTAMMMDKWVYGLTNIKLVIEMLFLWS